MRHLDSFVDGFLWPFAGIARVSSYLDRIGRRLGDWLIR